MQHDLNLVTKKFEAVFTGAATALKTPQPVTPGAHIVVHECTPKVGLTGRWVRVVVVDAHGNTATTRVLSRSQQRARAA